MIYGSHKASKNFMEIVMKHNSLRQAYQSSMIELVNNGQVIESQKWQGVKPPDNMVEIVHHTWTAPIPKTIQEMTTIVPCNIPWAEDHFQERISGRPLNPGNEYKNWPFYRGNVEQHKAEGEFTHTYMERFWPKGANLCPTEKMQHMGIRYPYGDLADVVDLLAKDKTTRQAYLPIWFPEDTGVLHGGRVPCTLGYHFICRDERLHCLYPIRSCDAVRHLPDDIYMACRLVKHIIREVQIRNNRWFEIHPGNLTMVFGSLHFWEKELELWKKRCKSWQDQGES